MLCSLWFIDINHSLIEQTAIPVLIGTKFDDFVKLPIEIQWTVVEQVFTQIGLGFRI